MNFLFFASYKNVWKTKPNILKSEEKTQKIQHFLG